MAGSNAFQRSLGDQAKTHAVNPRPSLSPTAEVITEYRWRPIFSTTVFN